MLILHPRIWHDAGAQKMPRPAPPTTRPRSRPRSAAGTRAPQRWNAALPDRDEQFQLKREALLGMAVRLFNERGYQATSLADIADHLHVTKPALYYYVSGKEEILLECQRRGSACFNDTIAYAEAHTGTGLEQFRDFLTRYVDAVTTDFAACLIRSGPDALDPQGRAEILRGRHKLEQTLEGILQKGIIDGSITACDTKMSAFTVFGALHWLCFWYREDGPLTRAEIAERMIALFTLGLEPRLAAAKPDPKRARKR
jgi:AcrR family transcriptional regulator